MWWPFKPKKKPVVVENIGPDAPKIKITAKILSYAIREGKLTMSLEIGKETIIAEVPATVTQHYPLGTDIRLVVEKQ